MLKHVLCGVIALNVVTFSYAAQEPNKVCSDVTYRFGLAADLAPADNQHADSGIVVMGKTVGAAVVGGATGGVLAVGLVVAKGAEAFGGPIGYYLLAAALLYSQYEIIKKLFGPEYTQAANWLALSTLVGVGGHMVDCNSKRRHVLNEHPLK